MSGGRAWRWAALARRSLYDTPGAGERCDGGGAWCEAGRQEDRLVRRCTGWLCSNGIHYVVMRGLAPPETLIQPLSAPFQLECVTLK